MSKQNNKGRQVDLYHKPMVFFTFVITCKLKPIFSNMSQYIYLDYAASTPIDPKILEQLNTSMTEMYANPSNTESLKSNNLADQTSEAATQILKAFNTPLNDLIFTSGATESINTILKGLYNHPSNTKSKIITAQTEHSAVFEVCKELESYGLEIITLKNNRQGEVDLQELKEQIDTNTLAVVLMGVNNETGLIHPLEQIADLAHQKDALFICDTTQTVGKIETNYQLFDAFTISAHKIYGPKGIGALVFNKKLKIAPLIHGGGQQNHLRAGTLPTPLILALEQAITLAQDHVKERNQHVSHIQIHFETELQKIADIQVIANHANRSPYISNIRFLHIDFEALRLALRPYVAFSSGSACKAKVIDTSRVIKALNLDNTSPVHNLRFSFSHLTTINDIDKVISQIKAII
ncbi:cysteine desulfurase [Halosquirtibacter xylanolyticus]|uniref:cysteine desulfurase family protein n=1 Tax=Halosquirtibacter xylanolyticus TaxID=3374599 RepID=UPI0037494AB8|nr:cysteine desulfurase [Prolixibacteraceae bacterium]